MASVTVDESSQASAAFEQDRNRLLIVLERINAVLAVFALILGLVMGPRDRPFSVITPASLRAFAVVSLLGLSGLVWLQRRGNFTIARTASVLVLTLEVLVIAPIAHVVHGWAILGFALPILAASLLMRAVMSFPIAALCAVISMLVDALALGNVPDPLPVVLLFLLACMSWLGTRLLQATLFELRTRLRAIEENAVRSKAFFEYANDAIIVLQEGRVVDCNPRTVALFGLPREMLLGQTPGDLSPRVQPNGQDSHEMAEGWIARALGGESQVFDWSHVHADGTPFDAEISLNAMDIGPQRYVHAIVRDVTARKRSEAALRESERRLQTLMSNLPGMAYRCLYSPERELEFASQGAQDVTGYAAEHLAGSHASYTQLIHRDDRDATWQLIVATVTEGLPYHVVYRIQRRDGEERWIREQGRAVTDASGETTHLEGFVEDITARRHALDALRASEDAYRSFYETAPNAIITIARDGAILGCNPRTLDLLTTTRNEIEGHAITHFVAPALHESISAALDAVFSEGRLTDTHLSMLSGNGSERQVVASMSLLERAGAPPCALCVVNDVTEQNQLERRLRQAQRLEAVGKFAGGIAHDFNNILSIIRGYCDFALSALGPDAPAYGYLTEIQQASERATELTQQILTLSRRQILELYPLDINRAITQAIDALAPKTRSIVDIRLNLADDLPTVNANTMQIGRVVGNLVANAADAMPDGGTVTISTQSAPADTLPPPDDIVLPRKPHVLLTVSDTGPGVPQEILDHLFEPFYTTKAPGKGTGLGLATVYAVVRQLEGTVLVNSTTGDGAEFLVYLPCADETSQPSNRAETNMPEIEIPSSASELGGTVSPSAPTAAL